MAHLERGRTRTGAPRVTALACVARVRARDHGGWRLRLADTGGALAAAEIRLPNLLPPPRRGTRVLICGRLRYDAGHGWYSIDPVEAWSDASQVSDAQMLRVGTR